MNYEKANVTGYNQMPAPITKRAPLAHSLQAAYDYSCVRVSQLANLHALIVGPRPEKDQAMNSPTFQELPEAIMKNLERIEKFAMEIQNEIFGER